MALSGVHLDHYLEVFKGIVAAEVQQNGSRLGSVPIVESLTGNKNWFDKIGKVSAIPKVSRLQERVYSDISFERRLITNAMITFDHVLDVEDLIRYVDNPQNEIVRAAYMDFGRQRDSVIINAISGNAQVQTNGSVANQALTLSVAVNANTFGFDRTGAALSGDTALHPGKLKAAKKKIAEAYGSNPTDELIVIAPEGQLMALMDSLEVVNNQFSQTKPLDGPGTIARLSGFLGMQFISYEDTGVDGSADEKVYVLTKDAIRLGVFQDMKVKMVEDARIVGVPMSLSVTQSLGAVRMDENKVVTVLCDPRKG